ncbi:MAG: glutaconyl-CoA decarboxylase subunit beta [Chloroflexi bacterium]|nr:glutaconyl-CoA decarboxylase subunit beta [Chloroflexota bacterium]|tara:strand:- start:106 stop:1230 length:1125 start_codon:yes stop_codon:yes gene_type:complete
MLTEIGINSQFFAEFASFWGNGVMFIIAGVFIYLAISKNFEPLLLIPIGLGMILANIPFSGIAEEGGFLVTLKNFGLKTELFPLLMFLGVGALTDFSALIQRPTTALLGAAAQVGIFGTLIAAVMLPSFSLQEAGAISIIGGADGPTAIYIANSLAGDNLLGPIAVSAYSYMALVPIIQPPIMRFLTTKKERETVMSYTDQQIPQIVRIIFPFLIILLTAMVAPKAAPLLGMLAFGNLLRESGVVERLSQAAQNEIINITTILLGITVGGTMTSDSFLNLETISIFVLGLLAFTIATSSGVLFGKIMYYVTRGKINPLIGAAGVSAVPMAARVVHRVGQETNPNNFLLMHAMGPNVAGVLGSAIAAGVLLQYLG